MKMKCLVSFPIKLTRINIYFPYLLFDIVTNEVLDVSSFYELVLCLSKRFCSTYDIVKYGITIILKRLLFSNEPNFFWVLSKKQDNSQRNNHFNFSTVTNPVNEFFSKGKHKQADISYRKWDRISDQGTVCLLYQQNHKNNTDEYILVHIQHFLNPE